MFSWHGFLYSCGECIRHLFSFCSPFSGWKNNLVGQVFLDKMLGISKRDLAGISVKKPKPVFQ